MLRRLVSRFRGSSSDGDEESADDETEDRGFTPSRLDASVLYAHGMGNYGVEWEIANLEEKERLLDEQQRRHE